MNIPNEAVEAAAMAIYQANGFDRSGFELDDYRADALRALEAAAPYIAQQAWNEGYEKGEWNAEHRCLELGPEDFNNPYGNDL